MESSETIELPGTFEDADTDHLVLLIADMLERLMVHNDKIPLSPESLTRFHSRTAPSISVLEYLRRIVKYANVESLCLLITLHYIDQICARQPHFVFSSLTAHRFIIASIAVSSKTFCDTFRLNRHYARIGGVRVAEFNVLEREFLALIDWTLTCSREVLDAYYINLIRTHSRGTYRLAQSSSPLSGVGGEDSDMDSVEESPQIPSRNFQNAGEEQEAQYNNVALLNDISTRQEYVAPDSNPASPDSRTMTSSSTTSATATVQRHFTVEPSTVLIDRATLSPRITPGPTFEQNMAFAALRANTGDPSSSSHAGPSSWQERERYVEEEEEEEDVDEDEVMQRGDNEDVHNSEEVEQRRYSPEIREGDRDDRKLKRNGNGYENGIHENAPVSTLSSTDSRLGVISHHSGKKRAVDPSLDNSLHRTIRPRINEKPG